MSRYITGVDFGTSSVKILCVGEYGDVVKVSQSYHMRASDVEAPNPALWWQAFKEAFHSLGSAINLKEIAAVSLTAQVGTYILYTPETADVNLRTVSWKSNSGGKQLRMLKSRLTKEYFQEHISMPHPDLISYPAPKILWFQEEFKAEWDIAERLLQPKDYLYHRLTGVFASDPYSWRGLANLLDGSFHEELLKEVGAAKERLPMLGSPSDAPGTLLSDIADELGVRSGIPVFIGCNDFFASLLGMGVFEAGQCFDMTGTSEHIGICTDKPDFDTTLVCGPYLSNYIHYGVTAHSGTSIDWAFENFGRDYGKQMDIQEMLSSDGDTPPPIFLPYMQGERAPIWDPKARGVFFGLEPNHSVKELIYAVLEGVSFSLFHIWSGLNISNAFEIRAAGGASIDDNLNRIKATLFNIPFHVMKEKDSAALGAAIFAGVGLGWFADIEEGIDAWVQVDHVVQPHLRFQRVLRDRFEVYKGLYPALKDSYGLWSELKGGLQRG